jgi:predicted acetyltransferase
VSREIRPVVQEELGAYIDVIRRAFGTQPSPTEEQIEWLSRTPDNLERSLAVFEDGAIIATAGAFSFDMTVPGGSLPTAGVTRVAVLPTHRRRGLLTSLMRRQLDDIHERGEPLAILYASEAPIYGRFGYGVASFHAQVSLPRGAAFRGPALGPGGVSFIEAERARVVFPRVWEAVKAGQPGMVTREPAWWDAGLEDAPARRPPGASPLYLALYQEGRRPTGFAVYRIRQEFTAGQAQGALILETLIARTVAAYAGLWRFLLDVDLVVRIEAESRPAAEPLLLLLDDPRVLDARPRDGIWLRLVDVSAALAGRSYSVDGGLVIEVQDHFCPWNQGTYELDVVGGTASCRRVRRRPDLVLDTDSLAATYLGGVGFRALARAARVKERRRGALSQADAMFASDPPPWCPVHF